MTDATMTLKMPDGTTSGPITMSDLERANAALNSGMKQTDADRDVSDKAYRASAAPLRAFVQRIERLEAEKKDIADQQKEVMAEAKWCGYDTKVLRMIIRERKRDKDDLAEEQAVLEMYREALGM